MADAIVASEERGKWRWVRDAYEDTTTLCVGGPLNGQHRTIHNDRISFRVIQPLRPGASAGERVTDNSVEYQLVWSRDHNRMVWWADGEVTK